MDAQLQVVVLPVRDVNRARDFYADQLGFSLEVDYQPSPDFRVVQLTPPGSACSIHVGLGLTDAAPGSVRNLCLVVPDIVAAREELAARGVDVGEIKHKSPVDTWSGGFEPGPAPDRRDYASFADFADPDGNTWVLQEIGHA